MQEYELGIIVRPTLTEEVVQSVVEKLKSIVVGQGGVVNSVDFWGKRKLAYPIEKHTEGYYVFLRFTLPPQNVAEVSRVARYTEDIIRHTLVKEEKKHTGKRPETPQEVPEEDLEPPLNKGGSDVSTQSE